MCDQIEFANVILLNKVEQVSEKEKEDIKTAVSHFNSAAEIIEVVGGQFDSSKVLNTGLFNFDQAEANYKGLDQGCQI